MNKSLFTSSLTAALVVIGTLGLNGCSTLDKDFDATGEHIQTFDNSSWENTRSILRAAERSGNLDMALETSKDFIAINPQHVDARVYAARALTRTGDAQQALRTLSFIKPEQQTAPVQLEMARAQMALGNTAKAHKILVYLVQENASDAALAGGDELARDIAKLYAVSLSVNGEFDQANTLFEKLMANSDEADVRYNYARSLMFQCRYDNAYELLSPLVESYPPARPAAAVTLWKMGRTDEGKALLKGLIEPSILEAWLAKQSQALMPQESAGDD